MKCVAEQIIPITHVEQKLKNTDFYCDSTAFKTVLSTFSNSADTQFSVLSSVLFPSMVKFLVAAEITVLIACPVTSGVNKRESGDDLGRVLKGVESIEVDNIEKLEINVFSS